ncbi:hypothetical protein AMJ52_08545 [candidate division TA06 bacterium DG_78]|uniref:Secretion system C-terminal sorting domain-containing protein n=1 Tax=candidate division TA06 bacterium DG_78 TaxID=1703772 RepID=A0A0S7Y9M2_UNCT6|nr:MAG: hypothetical protein AMJ52_08545 [candidate division TA06 bacterium DG_78]
MKVFSKSTKYIAVMVLIAPVTLLGQISWIEHNIASSFNEAYSVHAGDVDNDNDIDIVGAARSGDKITCWRNNGGNPPNFTAFVTSDTVNGPMYVQIINMDNDNDMDIFGVAWFGASISWWEQVGPMSFREKDIAHLVGAWSGYATDLDGDDDVDVLGGTISGNVYWWENDGNQNFTQNTIASGFSGTHSLYAVDLDDDSDIDIVGAAYTASKIAWWENDGDENFSEHTIDSLLSNAYCVYAADIDNDGDMDVLGAGSGVNQIACYENIGGSPANFTKHTVDSNFGGARSVFAADIDNDNDVDILGCAETANDITWWENDGGTFPGFTKRTIDDNFGQVRSLYADDIDSDGDMDVVAAGGTNITWWENKATHDVGPVSIDIDTLIPEGSTINPHATITNFGVNTEIFNVTCEIEPDAYTSTSVSILAPDEDIQVTFPDAFLFASGSYTVTVYTRLADDNRLYNDTLIKVIDTYTPGIADNSTSIPGTTTFNTATICRKRADIEFTLATATDVELFVYNVAGRFLKRLLSKRFSAGLHRLSVSLDLPAGVYFYNLKTESGERIIRKFLIVE